MWPYRWTHVGTPSHLGHMDRVAATMPSQAHAGAAQEAPDIGQSEGQDVPLVRPSSCNVKGGIPSSRRYLPSYLTSGKAGYHLGLAMLCLTHWIQRGWPPTGTVPCIGAIPTAHTEIEAGPDTRPSPPPGPQQTLTCGYHAIHRVLSRVGLSPKLAYPLPTTDQEVHQIRKLICEILAAAAEDGKLLPQTARPATGHASAPRRADTYTDTTHPTAQSTPMPLPSRCAS